MSDSLEEIHEGIKNLSAFLAKDIKEFLITERVPLKFCSTLEHFISWRIKLENLENKKWCDGVFNLALWKLTANSIRVKGTAYISYEEEYDMYMSDFNGTIKLSTDLSIIDNYSIDILFKDTLIQISH